MWEEVGSVDLEKEDVLVVAWLHSGSQIVFNPETSNIVNYNEKFTRAKMSPSFTQFGKKPVDGWIAVTSIGMVHVGLLLEQGSSSMLTAKACLGQTNTHITQADVAFTADGQLLVVTSDGNVASSIHCYLVRIALKNHICSVQSTPSASFFLKRQPMPEGITQEPRLTRLSFLSRENSEVLLACWGTASFSCIEAWHLLDQTIPLNRMFQNVAEVAFKTQRWMHKSSFTQRSGLTDIARPKLPISRTFNMESTIFRSYFACTYRDGTIKIVHRQTYQVLYTASMDQLINFKSLNESSCDPPGEKRLRLSSSSGPAPPPHLLSAVQTTTGCGLVGLGEGRLYLFRVFNCSGTGGDTALQMLPLFVVLLLEYTMFCGLDVWDVLLAVRQGMVEGIVDKLSSNFAKQSGAFQELLHQRLLRHKMALYSCLGPGNQRASDCRASITLHAITTVLKGCLRPKAISAQDKSPSEKLSNLCMISPEMDLDQIAKAIDPEEFVLESFKESGGTKSQADVSLQSLQPTIQWIADFILHLLAAVSMYPHYLGFPGATLLKDPQILSTLRELLIIIRVWGRLSPACLPVFMTTVTTLDPLPYLFRLVTTAWAAARDGMNVENDQVFMDECCSLHSKVLIPNYKKSFGEEMNCYLAFSQPFPINYQFGVEPHFLLSGSSSHHHHHRPFPQDLCLDADQKYDCVRQIQLGVRPREPLRECVRCKALSLRRKPSATKSALLRAWELRFVKSCLCGGHWKHVIISNSH
ncbi:hypothetical protein EGW08_009616 [Elysia chlorotica]|uniref:Mediator of RNA polymerase II transcription subunit 16 n=1 Tax=Elysia chlorotica TaxID=188477 RepID=A0A3S0ZPD0_ELYCH|nr:hypothetical protein EGW08_009616 [Elysia chlorotica]